MGVNPNPGRITNEMWRLWEECPIPGCKLGGIYANKKGYHNTVNANQIYWPRNNYSIRLPLDLVPDNNTKARAIDLTMTDKEMVKWTSRMKVSAEDPRDQRLAAVREFYGTLDGKTVFGLIKDDLDGPWRKASADLTHLWHGHQGFFTAFVDDWLMLSPSLSVWSGETYQEWSHRMEMRIAEVGDSGEVVRYWQQVHNTVRTTVNPASPILKVDGDYGAASSAAFLDFWKKSGGAGTTYKGTFITGWLAMQYHKALAYVSVPDRPQTVQVDPEQLKLLVNDWLATNVPQNLILTGEVSGRITIP